DRSQTIRAGRLTTRCRNIRRREVRASGQHPGAPVAERAVEGVADVYHTVKRFADGDIVAVGTGYDAFADRVVARMVHRVFGQDVGLLRALVDIDRIDHGQGAIAIPLEAAIGLVVDAADQIGRRRGRRGINASTRRIATLRGDTSRAGCYSPCHHAPEPGPR